MKQSFPESKNGKVLWAGSAILFFMTVFVPAVFAIGYGSVMDEKVRTSESQMSDNALEPAAAVAEPVSTNSADSQIPTSRGTNQIQKNTAVQNAFQALTAEAASGGGIPMNGAEVPPQQAVMPPGAPAEPGTPPSSSELRYAVQKYVTDASQRTGTFNYQDRVIGKQRRLILVRVTGTNDQGKKGYLMNADFSDIETGDLVNLEFELFKMNDNLNVIGIEMNTVNGQEPQENETAAANTAPVPIPQNPQK